MAEPRPRPRRRRGGSADRGEQAQRRVPGEGAEAEDRAHAREQPQLAHAPGQALLALGRRRAVGGRRAAHRRADPRAVQAQAVVAVHEVGWLAKPARHSAANRKSPERSPVNMRPVRLAPCAAGASPSTSRRAAGSPNPGSGRPQYSCSANAARRSRATCSRQATRRGQRRQSPISSASAAKSRSVT